MNEKQRKCWQYGHNWAYSFDNTVNGWILATCLRCGARQFYFTENEKFEPNMDDDSAEEPPY